MKILMVGSEAIPFASTGGLGDVMGSLPAALRKEAGEGPDVRVILPLYGTMRAEYREKLTHITDIYVNLSWRHLYCGIFSLERDGVLYYFLDNEY